MRQEKFLISLALVFRFRSGTGEEKFFSKSIAEQYVLACFLKFGGPKKCLKAKI